MKKGICSLLGMLLFVNIFTCSMSFANDNGGTSAYTYTNTSGMTVSAGVYDPLIDKNNSIAAVSANVYQPSVYTNDFSASALKDDNMFTFSGMKISDGTLVGTGQNTYGFAGKQAFGGDGKPYEFSLDVSSWKNGALGHAAFYIALRQIGKNGVGTTVDQCQGIQLILLNDSFGVTDMVSSDGRLWRGNHNFTAQNYGFQNLRRIYVEDNIDVINVYVDDDNHQKLKIAKIFFDMAANTGEAYILQKDGTFNHVTSFKGFSTKLPGYIDAWIYYIPEKGNGNVICDNLKVVQRDVPLGINSFGFKDMDAKVTIDNINQETNVLVPPADLSKLTATFDTNEGTSVKVNGIQQISGESIQNFAKPLVYEIADDYGSTLYTVNVSVDPNQVNLPSVLEKLNKATPEEIGDILDIYYYLFGLSYKENPYYKSLEQKDLLDEMYTIMSEMIQNGNPVTDEESINATVNRSLGIAALKLFDPNDIQGMQEFLNILGDAAGEYKMDIPLEQSGYMLLNDTEKAVANKYILDHINYNLKPVMMEGAALAIANSKSSSVDVKKYITKMLENDEFWDIQDTYGSWVEGSAKQISAREKIYNKFKSREYIDIADVKSDIQSMIAEVISESGGSSGPSSGPSRGSSGKKHTNGIIGTSELTLQGSSLPTVTPIETPKPQMTFSDMNEAPWAEAEVADLVGKRIVSGYPDGTFKPNQPITKEECIKMIVTALGINDNSKPTQLFNDIAEDAWYYDYIVRAKNANIISGFDGNFGINTTLTREDLAVILYRALKNSHLNMESGKPDFIDSSSISDYAAEAVGTLQKLKIISGLENGEFDATGDATRGMVAKMLSQAMQLLNR